MLLDQMIAHIPPPHPIHALGHANTALDGELAGMPG
jgi:hypothetical protein